MSPGPASAIDLDRLFKLRLVLARYGEMDLAGWWNTQSLLEHPGALMIQRGFPRTHRFARARAVFVARGIQLLRPGGLLGAITSRTGFFLSSFQKWRETILLKEAPPAVVADLGHGVMDDAMVEAAAYCLIKRCQRHDVPPEGGP